ncbi:MAG TPA: ribonuclease HII [Candidatus Bathyarchaeia archaeon]|nr:ribonuclease HII [Candidatus Bathyarchaeia archaeon]
MGLVRICGVDDAGRGPVIGPLVIAGVIIEEAKLDRLKMLGVKDSKQLLASARIRLSKEIPEVVDDFHVVELRAEELDRIVNRAPKFQRLNLLEAKGMAQVIEKLKPELAYVDSSDTRTERFKNNILDCLSFTPRIVSEHKADVNYPVVSAASIMAKVHRDTRIEEIKKEYGEIGSGYAHDALTVKFLRDYYSDHGDFPPIVRRSWKTLGNIVRDLTQSTLG